MIGLQMYQHDTSWGATSPHFINVFNHKKCGYRFNIEMEVVRASVFSVYVCNVSCDSLTVCTKLGIVCVSINAVRV